MFISRRQSHSTRFTIWKLALLFAGAGIWIAGMLINNFQVTLAAIFVVAIGLLLSLVERRGEMKRSERLEAGDEHDPAEEDDADRGDAEFRQRWE